jgi:hypothetical protein
MKNFYTTLLAVFFAVIIWPQNASAQCPVPVVVGPTNACTTSPVVLAAYDTNGSVGTNSMVFNGYNSLVSRPDFELETSDFTIEASIKPLASNGYIITNRGNYWDASGNWFVLLRDGNGRMVLELSMANSTYQVYISNSIVPNGVWSHVALVRQGTTLSMYINGELDWTVTESVVRDLTGAASYVYLGGEGAFNAAYWQGAMDNFRVWNVAKTQGEIAASRYNVISSETPNLISNIHSATANQIQEFANATPITSAYMTFESPTTAPLSDPTSTYLWSTGATTQSISTSVTGTYTVDITNAANCTASVSHMLNSITAPTTYYADADGDGFGNAAISINVCAPVAGYVTNPGDCNDSNASLNPNMVCQNGGTSIACGCQCPAGFYGDLCQTAGFFIPASGSNEVLCGTNTTLFDSGGPTGNVIPSSNGYTVLRNSFNSQVTLSGSYQLQYYYQALVIYNGSGTSGAVLATYAGSGTITPISSLPGQELTVQIINYYSWNWNQWGAQLNVAYTGTCSDAACDGAPTPGSTIASATLVCATEQFALSIQNTVFGLGVTHQWQSAASQAGPYSNIDGATAPSLNTTTLTTKWFRDLVSCAASGESTPSTPIQVVAKPIAQCYCIPETYGGCEVGVGIARFKINTLDRTGLVCTPISYNDFTQNAGLTTNLQQGNLYEVTIQTGAEVSGFAVWLDDNDDGVFSPVERIGYTQYTIEGNSTGTFNVQIPCNATVGQHRLRIIAIHYYDGQYIDDACYVYSNYAHVEDYTVSVVTPDACPAPQLINAYDVTATAATISWFAGCSGTEWEYALQPYGAGAPASGTSTITELVSFTGLTGNTQYEFYVRSVCDSGASQSAWVAYAFWTVPNDPGYGNNVWNVSSSDVNGFRGYYVDTNLGVFTENFWNNGLSPSSAPGYIGAATSLDNFDFTARRQGFPAGCYTINILGHDDASWIVINGTTVFVDMGCCDTHDNVWTGYLDASSQVEIWTHEDGGLALARYEFVPLNSGNFYADTDGDGYGDATATVMITCSPPANYVLNNTDCDDTKASVHPGAAEIGYNLTDDDCDGQTDEGFVPKVTTMQSAMCNTTLAALDSQLVANIVTGAQGYRWRITTTSGPNTGQIQELDTALRVLKLTQLPNYAFGTQYKVEVAVYYAGFLQPFTASTCTVTTPSPVTLLSVCGQNLTAMANVIYANSVQYAAGYRFTITDPIAPVNTQTIERNLREFRMNLITAFSVQYNKQYNVTVSVKNTDGTWLPYGATCSVTTPAFPTTSLQDSQCDGYLVPNANTPIYALSYPAAIAYVFQISGGGLLAPIEVTKTIRTFKLSDFAGLLTPGATYNVRVRLVFNVSDPIGPYGKTCSITVPGAARIASHKNVFDAVAYPNPFAEYFNIDVTTSATEVINIRIYDMTGRLLENRDNKAGNEIQIGNSFPSGVYNVIVTQGDESKTLRVVKR